MGLYNFSTRAKSNHNLILLVSIGGSTQRGVLRASFGRVVQMVERQRRGFEPPSSRNRRETLM